MREVRRSWQRVESVDIVTSSSVLQCGKVTANRLFDPRIPFVLTDLFKVVIWIQLQMKRTMKEAV